MENEMYTKVLFVTLDYGKDTNQKTFFFSELKISNTNFLLTLHSARGFDFFVQRRDAKAHFHATIVQDCTCKIECGFISH